MEIIIVLIVGFLLGIPVIAIVALVRSGNTRRLLDEASLEFRDKISDLRGEIAGLRRQLNEVSGRMGHPPPASSATPAAAPQGVKPASEPVAAPPETARPIAHPAPAALVPERAASAFTASLSVPAPATQAFLNQPRPSPAKPRVEPPAHPDIPRPLPPTSPPQAPPLPSAAAAKTERPADAGPAPRPGPPAMPQPQRAAQPSFASGVPRFAAVETAPPGKSFAEGLRATLPLEEVLGMNLFAKLGIVLLVLGFALLGRVALISMGPGARVALIYAAGSALLGGGIWLERKERYRIVGRAGIGGGWATLFFTTYAMYHVPAMTIMSSSTLNCVLMLVVAVAMVAHTLRYKSQVVTGLAFLLAFSTVALSQDSVYALTAGVILALGIVAIALRMGWYELEVFGILASFGNHFYWLYRLYPDGVAGHPFPQFWPSATILILYWAIFRFSYIARRIRAPRDETVSTIAALLNTMLLGAVMKFQSTHPELVFYAILAIGAAEFACGQLPVTRRRRPAFILLTVMGTMLMFASVPFKFSGNSIALFWMIAAEVLLIAGIVQLEVVFRRLGLLAGLVTGLLVVYESQYLVEFRQQSEAQLLQDGVLLLTCSALFYLNSLFIARKWRHLLGSFDGTTATLHSYIGCVTAFLGVWGVITGDWTAIGWSALMLGAALGARYLNSKHLIAQASALFAAMAIRAAVFNCHLSDLYPHHIALRLATLPMLAAVCYGTAWALSGVDDLRVAPRMAMLWTGTALLVTLGWLELPPVWIAGAWMALAVVLALIGRRSRIAELAYQEHVLAAMVAAQLVAVNLDAQSARERYLPFLGCAGALYAISRFCTLKDAVYRRPAAWLHTWGATALIATLAWNESPQPWLAAIWALFALALAVTDRIFDVEELPYQAHVLALLAVARAMTLNLYMQDKWHGVDLRLITVGILVAVLYAMALWVRMPGSIRGSEARHAYTWVGSGLAAWLLWRELQPIAVAVGLAVFGLLLFEFGTWRQQKQIRLQAYVALAAAFARIFFVNLTAETLPGEALSPRIYTVVPIALIYFFVWAQLQSEKAAPEIGRWRVADLIAYFGTGCVAALLYFQTPAEWIVVAWSILAVVMLGATLLLDKEVFHQQAALLVAGIVVRGLAHNIFGGSYFVEGGWRGNFAVLSLAAALLLAALPIAFRLRKRYAERTGLSFLSRCTAVNHPEQLFFFAPIILVTFMIAVKMNPGMVTLSWGIEGVMVIVLGLLASQRSYRITGLLLLLLCVGKIVFHDVWKLPVTEIYITFIALGAAMTLVSALYGRYREIVRRLL
ncbi:MAG: DUF2339 domain-containing protein [Terracidiphilus sp.]|jgi:hypothetical protein